MKKYFFNLTALLLMVSGLIFFTSCNEDGDENSEPKPDSPIVGEWEYESADISIEINDRDIIDYFVDVFEISEDSAEVWKEMFTQSMNNFDGMRWTFSSNHSFTVNSPEGNETGTWSLSNDNKKLSVISDGETDVIDVKTLSTNKLELFYEETFEEDLNDDEEDENISISMTLALKK